MPLDSDDIALSDKSSYEGSDADLFVVLDKEGTPRTFKEKTENFLEVNRLLRDLDKRAAMDLPEYRYHSLFIFQDHPAPTPSASRAGLGAVLRDAEQGPGQLGEGARPAAGIRSMGPHDPGSALMIGVCYLGLNNRTDGK
jgi:hypothetical protein